MTRQTPYKYIYIYRVYLVTECPHQLFFALRVWIFLKNTFIFHYRKKITKCGGARFPLIESDFFNVALLSPLSFLYIFSIINILFSSRSAEILSHPPCPKFYRQAG
eukprot:GEMP01023330.1.p2 GENE.GEMP01023330.1~~GEMP01023330.1.p2  ORF type:complete len:106 (+),score=2.31 GEMP01023330.1:1574-1891(+)